MKKVSPFMWSLGIGSTLAWLILKPENRRSIKNALRQVKLEKTPKDDEIYYV